MLHMERTNKRNDTQLQLQEAASIGTASCQIADDTAFLRNIFRKLAFGGWPLEPTSDALLG